MFFRQLRHGGVYGAGSPPRSSVTSFIAQEIVYSGSEYRATSLLLRAFKRQRASENDDGVDVAGFHGSVTLVSCLLVATATGHLYRWDSACAIAQLARFSIISAKCSTLISVLHNRRRLTNPSALLTQFLACSG